MKLLETWRVGFIAISTAMLAVSGISFAAKAVPKPARAQSVPSVAPGFLGANGLPRIGMRIVYDSGSQTLEGTAGVRRNGNGRKVDQYGNPVPEMSLENQAGVGFTTVDIVQSSAAVMAADMSQFLRMGPNLSQIFRIGAQAVRGNGTKMSDYWDSPAALAKIPVGKQGRLTISRGRLSIAGHSLNTISFSTTDATGTNNSTYDLGSGLLLFANTDMRANPLARDVAPAQDARITTYIRLLGVRKLGYSWLDATPPASLTPGRKLSYQGGMQTVIPNVPPMLATPLSTVVTIAKRAGLCVFAQVTSSFDSARPALGSRAYGSASTDALWVPPAAIAALHAGQVLDTDSITGFRVTFLGIQKGVATFQEQNPTQRNIRLYSVKSGLELGSRTDTQMSNSVQTTILQLQVQG